MLYFKARFFPVLCCSVFLFLSSCGTSKKESAGENPETNSGPIKTLTSAVLLDTIIEKAGNSLLAFDLYADWCMPCRILAPTLEKIAQSNLSKVTF